MGFKKIGTLIYSDGTKSDLLLTKSGKVIYKPVRKPLWSILKQLLSLGKES
jgi:hypothetical protein